ncbi:MAG: hypothetical protein CVU65_03850 [Deltaproteobacteria bacterium HGW-Deltaproteobacteria-22]|jgi:hypothetical protein|nr:MAG: hypothetical protein CVU65_03850 [Deltaproteobacteria bacterium HGW-Deltaproteobacteria-22]
MKYIESYYVNNRNERVGFRYSIDSVVRLHLVFRILGLFSIFAALPCFLFSLLCLFDSPTKPMLGYQFLGGSLVCVLIGVFLWFGLSNLILMLVEMRSRLDHRPRN